MVLFSLNDKKAIIQECLDSFDWNNYGLRCSVVSDVKVPHMVYNRKNRTIRIGIEWTSEVHKNLDFYSFKELILMGLCHELGHHLHFENDKERLQEMMNNIDYTNKKEVRKWRIFTERKAWEFGRDIVPSELIEKFDEYNLLNLCLYEDYVEYFKQEEKLKEKYKIKLS